MTDPEVSGPPDWQRAVTHLAAIQGEQGNCINQVGESISKLAELFKKLWAHVVNLTESASATAHAPPTVPQPAVPCPAN